jgi:cob(I)alamin adenosyltransferase
MTNKPKSKGLIQVYCGNGKGKTTAALGLLLRAVGAGKRCCFIQFDKGGDHYSERRALLERLGDAIDVHVTGLDRIDPVSGRFRFGVTDEDQAEARRGIELAADVAGSGRYDLVVLDEFNHLVQLGLTDENSARGVLDAKHPDTELVMTGRTPPEFVVNAADLITEVQEVRHYFRKGVPARSGFDF